MKEDYSEELHAGAKRHRAHKHAGRRLGRHDYAKSAESHHLSHEEKKDSHFKHDALISD